MLTEPTLHNIFREYEEEALQVFASDNQPVFCSRLKQFKHEHEQYNTALFISKIMKLLLQIHMNTQKLQWMKKEEANYVEYLIW